MTLFRAQRRKLGQGKEREKNGPFKEPEKENRIKRNLFLEKRLFFHSFRICIRVFHDLLRKNSTDDTGKVKAQEKWVWHEMLSPCQDE
jgi:hypothetical protein